MSDTLRNTTAAVNNKTHLGMSAGLVAALIMSGCASGPYKVGSPNAIPEGETVSNEDQLNADLDQVKAHSAFSNSPSR